MAQKKKNNPPPVQKKPAPEPEKKQETATNTLVNPVADGRAFKKDNYLIMFAGLFLLIAGLVIMSIDKEPFGFGFYGLTLGPSVVFAGFMVQFFAIFKK